MIATALALHVLAAVIWVGGMFFAYMFLRPVAADLLETPVRLKLWSLVFSKFFNWVWAAIVLIPATGYLIIFQQWDGFEYVGKDIHLMHAIGLIMFLIFLHVFFAPYRRMNLALQNSDIKEAGRRLGQIRKLVAVNMTLGLIVISIASGGRYFAFN